MPTCVLGKKVPAALKCYFCSIPINGHRQTAPACLKGAKAQSRCAPARCAGARAGRLVADGEDSDSGVATINSRIVGVQRMIKNSRIIYGQHLSRRTTSTQPIMQLQNWLDE